MSLEQHSEAAQLRIGLRKPNDLSAWLNRLAVIRTSLSVSVSSRLMRELKQPKWQISRGATTNRLGKTFVSALGRKLPLAARLSVRRPTRYLSNSVRSLRAEHPAAD